MAKRLKDIKEIKIERPPRAKLSDQESLKRTQEFDKRKERFIASMKGQGLRSICQTFRSPLIKICWQLSIENSPTHSVAVPSFADSMGAIFFKRVKSSGPDHSDLYGHPVFLQRKHQRNL